MVDAERLTRLLRRITDDVRRLRRADPTTLLDDAVVLDHLSGLDHLDEFVDPVTARYL